MASITGIVTRIRKKPDPDTGRCTLQVDYDTFGKISSTVMFANARNVAVGDAFSADGEWRTSPYMGKEEETFSAWSFRPDVPKNEGLLLRWLKENFDQARHGLTPEAIDAAFKASGIRMMDSVETATQALASRTSAPDRFRRAIAETLESKMSGTKAMALLKDSGLDDGVIARIISAIPENPHGRLLANPYSTAPIPQVGFVNADLIGRKMGVPVLDRRRLLAAVTEVLRDLASKGSTSADSDVLMGRLHQMSGVDPERLVAFLREESHKDDHGLSIITVKGRMLCALKDLFQAEAQVTVRVARTIMSGRRNGEARVRAAAADLFLDPKFKRFDPVQRLAVEMAAVEPFSIVTGGPGTGKSTVMEAVVALASRFDAGPVLLVAPTGNAAKRLSATTGQKASTLHRLLRARESGPDGATVFAYNRDKPLPAGCFVVVDEASMIDVQMTSALLQAMPPDGRLLLVGDYDQLPSVGPGAILRDLLLARMQSGSGVPSVKLEAVYRQGKDSGIAHGAAQIRRGEVPDLAEEDRGGVSFRKVPPAEIGRYIERLVCEELPREDMNPLTDVATLCAQAPGNGGSHEINRILSRRLNPNGLPLPGVTRGTPTPQRGRKEREEPPMPRMGDRIMTTWNDDKVGITNGSIGFIVGSGTHPTTGKPTIRIKLDDGPEFEHPASRWQDMMLAYAITVHKSQGSQYGAVVMPLLLSQAHMLERRLVYTGWTRAKSRLLLVGEVDALELAIANAKEEDRITLVRDLMTMYKPDGPVREPIDWGSRAQVASRALAALEAASDGRKAVSAPQAAPAKPGTPAVSAPIGQAPTSQAAPPRTAAPPPAPPPVAGRPPMPPVPSRIPSAFKVPAIPPRPLVAASLPPVPPPPGAPRPHQPLPHPPAPMVPAQSSPRAPAAEATGQSDAPAPLPRPAARPVPPVPPPLRPAPGRSPAGLPPIPPPTRPPLGASLPLPPPPPAQRAPATAPIPPPPMPLRRF